MDGLSFYLSKRGESRVSSIPDASVLELYPDEMNKLKLIMARVSRKYLGLPNTLQNMASYQKEIVGRCRDEINLEVDFDAANMEMGDDGKMYSSPILTPIKRLTPEVFDFARARYETQQGFVDGNPGVITEDGRWVEPPKPVAMGGSDVAGS